MASTTDELSYEPLEYDQRYYIQTAKSNISSFVHVVAEVVTNADEAISKRAARDGTADTGTIRLDYDPDSIELVVVDDGIGLLTVGMNERLKRVGAQALTGTKRAFFHRGIREVFTAMGLSTVESIALGDDGLAHYSRAVFDPAKGMAIAVSDLPVTDELRAQCGIERNGMLVRVPLSPLAHAKPRLFEFSQMEQQIIDCVQIRPVMSDPNRKIPFEYGGQPPRHLHFEYPNGETLVLQAEVTIGGHKATFWAKAADKPIKSTFQSKQTRRNGILIRGERAAYEVTLGSKLKASPGMSLVFGELRIDDIEAMQREADANAEVEAQLIYKADRSGLNPDHPFVEQIYDFIDATLAPLVANLETRSERKAMTADIRRQFAKLAQIINKAIKSESFGDIATSSGEPDPEKKPQPDGPEPPDPDDEAPVPVVDDGIAFARDRIFINAGDSRTVKVFIDTTKIPIGTPVELVFKRDDHVRAARLSGSVVPQAPEHGVAQLSLTIEADNTEGRHELLVRTGPYEAALPVHVRFPRASGFISSIELDDRDWESGSALYNSVNGRVTVYVGRPEFKDAAERARKDNVQVPFEHPLYIELVVESVREAALREAAQRRAEVEWDDLSHTERQEKGRFLELVQTAYYELDYQLRAVLLKVFLD